MSKKEKIVIHRPENLENIDTELDQALGSLDGVNQRVSELLRTYATPTPPADENAAPPIPNPTP